jgi:hypothetical protein
LSSSSSSSSTAAATTTTTTKYQSLKKLDHLLTHSMLHCPAFSFNVYVSFPVLLHSSGKFISLYFAVRFYERLALIKPEGSSPALQSPHLHHILIQINPLHCLLTPATI